MSNAQFLPLGLKLVSKVLFGEENKCLKLRDSKTKEIDRNASSRGLIDTQAQYNVNILRGCSVQMADLNKPKDGYNTSKAMSMHYYEYELGGRKAFKQRNKSASGPNESPVKGSKAKCQ